MGSMLRESWMVSGPRNLDQKRAWVSAESHGLIRRLRYGYRRSAERNLALQWCSQLRVKLTS